MGMEVLLYGYGAVCLSMILFNLVYSIVLRGSHRRLRRKSDRLQAKVQAQLARIGREQAVEPGHLRYLRRTLSRAGNLIAFDRMLEEGQLGANAAMSAYLAQMQPVILQLALTYCRRENLQAAYYAYFLARHQPKRFLPMDPVQEVMLRYMHKNSLYCRLNALEALYQFGSPEKVVQAVALLDRLGAYLHEKVLTDGLLSYRGDAAQLTRLLWEEFERFSERTRLSVLNYIRFRTGDYCPQMLQILTDTARDKELRLSAIRYFGRYAYLPARAVLLELLRNRDPLNWEYAAVSAAALARYRGEEVAQALMEAMHSPHWYVRYNAAASLQAQDLDYSQLIRVVGGGDRYAREMMMYRLDTKRMEQERGEADAGCVSNIF